VTGARTAVNALTRAVARLSTRRRHRLAPALLLLAALGATGGAYAAFAPTPHAEASATTDTSQVEEGRQLFLRNCSSCHGLNAQGTTDGPTLIGVGAASVDFQVGTGRMPAARTEVAQVPDKPVQFNEEEIAAMAAYVASLAPGPAIPSEEQLDLSDADIAEGGEIYRTNCAMCHNFAGQGGALTRGKYAPSLEGVSPEHIYEAMLTGPQSMPVFADTTLDPEAKQDLIAFLQSIENSPDPGGANLGRLGPVTEGAVGWFVATAALVACAVWLGAKAR
jgi:ubiquinol-cytochrome c reductase cytochrome c subunit